MNSNYFFWFCLLFISYQCVGQSGSEIILFDIKSAKGKISLSNPKNITQHKGYDNQPSFDTSKPSIYYSSFNDEGRSDIKVYNYKTGITEALTNTVEREYSPTLTPDGKFISCIIQRDNKAQDVGKYPVEGGAATIIIDNLIVGYHAWINEDQLLLFVLGDTPTFHLYSISTKKDSVLTDAIGRSLHKIPNSNAMSFVKKNSDTDWVIMKLDTKTLAMTNLIAALPGREDLCWTPAGRIIMSDGIKIYSIDPVKEKEWSEVHITNSSIPLKAITRLAISPKGNKLAVVVAE
jgi:Tol biopolymer transport system component